MSANPRTDVLPAEPVARSVARKSLHAYDVQRLVEFVKDTGLMPRNIRRRLPPTPRRRGVCHQRAEQARFSRLGFEILSQEAAQDSLGISSSVWLLILPQLNAVNPAVNAAVASLGACYESLVLRSVSAADYRSSLATVQYQKALSELQNEIVLQSHGLVPLFLASIILAAVEVLQRHLINAITHLRGAYQVLTQYICVRSEWFLGYTSKHVGNMVQEIGRRKPSDEVQSLYLIAQALDLQTATYALAQPPDLPPSPPGESMIFSPHTLSLSSLAEPQSHLVPLLHACYHFTSLASQYKYVRRSCVPVEMALNQGRYIASLSQWLIVLNNDRCVSSVEHQSPLTPSKRFNWWALRIQCLSALIYLSTIFDPFEKGYDAFTTCFSQIVEGVAILLETNLGDSPLTRAGNRFRLTSPVSQPLYLVAMKCRHRQLRRAAIRLLVLTGRGGPWDGAIHALVAERAVKLEEQGLDEHDGDPPTAVPSADKTSIPEELRLHGCGVDTDRSQHADSGTIKVIFSRCRDVETMTTSSDLLWNAAENWDIWSETLKTPAGQT
ncbi:hypothetical protein MMC13_000768 [Lambiella insularis]|nr:hypothetical protein [Lambiella insularis]